MAQHFVPFGTGSRVCGGQNLAQLMLKITVATVARNFDIEAPPETNEKTMEMRDSFVSPLLGVFKPISRSMLRELGHLSRFYAVQSHLQTSTPLIPIVSHLLTAALIITHSLRMRHLRQYARMTLGYQTCHGLFCSTLPALLYNESCSCAFLTPTDGHHILYCTNLNNDSHEAYVSRQVP
jgi:hypothetical protein